MTSPTALDAEPSVTVLQPFALEVVRLAVSFPSQRRLIETELLAIVRGTNWWPHELLELTAHLLRWPSLRAEIESDHRAAITKPDHRAEPILRDVLAAFDDPWQCAEMYPELPISAVDVAFQPAEFAALLHNAATSLVESCRDQFCDPAPPQHFAFVFAGESRDPRQRQATDAILRQLLQPDGSFRDWVNLSPIGIHREATIVEIEHAAKFTHRLLIGPRALRFEPFHLLGPALPPEFDGVAPIPKVALPSLNLG